MRVDQRLEKKHLQALAYTVSAVQVDHTLQAWRVQLGKSPLGPRSVVTESVRKIKGMMLVNRPPMLNWRLPASTAGYGVTCTQRLF